MDAKTGLGATKTSFTIVERLVETGGSKVSELADDLDMPKSTVYTHLRTLRDLGYVHKQDGVYCPTLRFLDLGNQTQSQKSLYHNAKSELQKLAEETGEHASLIVQEKGYAVILDTVKGNHSVHVDTHAGIRMAMHTTAPGKAILAFCSPEQVQEIVESSEFRPLTQNSITDRETLYDELETIQERKFSLDNEERMEGIRAVAVPVLDRDDHPLGSLSVFGPTNRITDDRFRETLPQKLKQAANVVEINMNYA